MTTYTSEQLITSFDEALDLLDIEALELDLAEKYTYGAGAFAIALEDFVEAMLDNLKYDSSYYQEMINVDYALSITKDGIEENIKG